MYLLLTQRHEEFKVWPRSTVYLITFLCFFLMWSFSTHYSTSIDSSFTALPLFWTSASKRGFELPDLVRLLSKRTAQLCSLDHLKGSLAPGYDADLVIWDPDSLFQVSKKSHLQYSFSYGLFPSISHFVVTLFGIISSFLILHVVWLCYSCQVCSLSVSSCLLVCVNLIYRIKILEIIFMPEVSYILKLASIWKS